MKASTALRRTLRLLDAGRWTTGQWSGRDRPVTLFGRRFGRKVKCYCLLGALKRVITGSEVDYGQTVEHPAFAHA